MGNLDITLPNWISKMLNHKDRPSSIESGVIDSVDELFKKSYHVKEFAYIAASYKELITQKLQQRAELLQADLEETLEAIEQLKS